MHEQGHIIIGIVIVIIPHTYDLKIKPKPEECPNQTIYIMVNIKLSNQTSQLFKNYQDGGTCTRSVSPQFSQFCSILSGRDIDEIKGQDMTSRHPQQTTFGQS